MPTEVPPWCICLGPALGTIGICCILSFKQGQRGTLLIFGAGFGPGICRIHFDCWFFLPHCKASSIAWVFCSLFFALVFFSENWWDGRGKDNGTVIFLYFSAFCEINVLQSKKEKTMGLLSSFRPLRCHLSLGRRPSPHCKTCFCFCKMVNDKHPSKVRPSSANLHQWLDDNHSSTC